MIIYSPGLPHSGSTTVPAHCDSSSIPCLDAALQIHALSDCKTSRFKACNLGVSLYTLVPSWLQHSGDRDTVSFLPALFYLISHLKHRPGVIVDRGVDQTQAL